MSKEKFTCAMCEKTFDKGWSDEEAKEELSEVFPNTLESECEMVCDDCYEKLGLKA